ncbi:UNVERIFIED_CONTAM: hypothetical protein FKN15_073414 [Acipenser sinensis]
MQNYCTDCMVMCWLVNSGEVTKPSSKTPTLTGPDTRHNVYCMDTAADLSATACAFTKIYPFVYQGYNKLRL